MSDATTYKLDDVCKTEGDEHVLMINDVSRAYFYAPVRHKIYIKLVDEAKDEPDDDEK